MFHSYYDSWKELSTSKKREWLDESKGGYLNYFSKYRKQSKRRILLCVAEDLKKHPEELAVMYQMILDMGYKNEQSYSIYEFILWWLINEMKCGEPYDRYWIFFALEEYYSRNENLERAIEIDIMAYNELDTYLDDIHYYADDEYLPSFVFCRDRLQYNLCNNHQYAESRWYEEDSIQKGYYAGEKGEERLRFNRCYRLQSEIPYLIKNNEIENAILRCDDLKQLNSSLAGWHYKMIGYAYYKQKKYVLSKHYYTIAIQLTPNISGVKRRLEAIEKKLK